MSLNVTLATTCTIIETLPGNTGSAPDATRKVTHTEYNEAAVLTGATTPPVTQQASFLATLSSGTLSIDLRALNGTNGASIDGNGLKVQYVRVKNLGANTLTIVAGASNGHSGIFPSSGGVIVPPGGHVAIYSNDNGDDIGASDKTWDLSGTGSQTSEWTIVMG